MSHKKDKQTLSKSQYVKGLSCPLSLWFYRAAMNQNNPGADTPAKQSNAAREAVREMGEKIGQLAKSRFPGGVEVTAKYSETGKAVQQTQDFIKAGKDVIFEATAVHPTDGSYCRIDILRKVPGTADEWDMIEVKSSTKVKPAHYDDITFQRHVFEGAGYKIRNCQVMYVDNSYVRKGAVDPHKLLKLQNVNRSVKAREGDIAPNLAELVRIVELPQPPIDDAHKKCSPGQCESKDQCWGNLPLYSIFNVYSGKDLEAVYAKTGSYRIEDIPDDLKPAYQPKRAELEAHLSGQPHVDQKALGTFLDGVKYPVYYLDYESVQSAIPLYEGTRPYQQVPFQFSLHVQEQKDGPLTHVGFLHKQTDDPRRAFAEALVTTCGDEGSVIVYFKDFEASRNNELARDFPEYAADLAAINDRMVDIFEPFKQRWLYDPSQNGSVSLKTVLPTYTNITYKNMAIGNGEQALQEYLAFVTGKKKDPAERQALWDGLEEYCKQDTYAMVRLIDVLYEKAARQPGTPPQPDPQP